MVSSSVSEGSQEFLVLLSLHLSSIGFEPLSFSEHLQLSFSLCMTFFRLNLVNAYHWRFVVKPEANNTDLRTFILKRGLCFAVNITVCFLTFSTTS